MKTGSLWEKFNLLKCKVSKWHHLKYTSTSSSLKECEDELSAILTNYVPQGDFEHNSFRNKQRYLSMELENLRMIEGRG